MRQKVAALIVRLRIPLMILMLILGVLCGTTIRSVKVNYDLISYLDDDTAAMRGLAMLMVVMGHVALFSFGHTSDNFFLYFCGTVQVPLFFLVSGMCYRLPREWSAKSLWQFLSSKAFILCVPASLFLGAFRYPDFDINMVTSPYKSGYWFTYTRFRFICFKA